jgi:hypothetical protein
MISAGHARPENFDRSYALLDGVFRHLMQGQISDTPRDRKSITNIFR